MMTLLKLDRELLMFFVSSSLKPVEPDSLSLSDPAKSQQIECTATRLAGDGVGACDIEHEHPECNLDDLSLQFVAATAQFLHVVKIQVKIQLFV
jgi:hypothetical protein